MKSVSLSLPARYMAQLVDYLESIGIDRKAMLRAVRIRSLDNPGGQLSLPQLEALLRAAEEATGRFDLGFELGRRLNPTSHDLLGFAMLSSPTFGHMLRLAVVYQSLMQPLFSLRMEREGGRVELVYRPAAALTQRTMRVFQEAILVTNHVGFETALREGLRPYEAWLSIEAPAHARRYRELSAVKVHFGDAVPGLRIALDAALLDTPLAMANPRAMRAAEDRCKAMLRHTRARRRWSEWCRMMLRESTDVQPTLEQLAGFVNISARTLARYLEAEKSSFRALSLEVRIERARTLLSAGELSVTEIAYRLGYRDVASFVRAFRARTGSTPGAYRA